MKQNKPIDCICKPRWSGKDGTYDYDGIAETVIKLCKNK